ncbi:hypothetical protein AVV44_gp117 [Cronobacter phage S13]|jgi:hypothetical protein|uniref:Uncharacterized protein n=1 Tax=Cronobacter phage LPCS28 TaxID=2924885 RepID=A0AAE9G9H8_9CAUD|nr:hypothetical protein AVV44_gp117 [Cronobacter phage S13]YP_010665969.1 hypothetical protein PQB73_gp055 [Cronobacter phage LPCS28]AIA64916.1 hypothetical protein S13_117 [Cronobacter phage S13]UNY47158.1 hypothetical protein EHEKIMEA_00276 [Cronobacter phage LPCS28]
MDTLWFFPFAVVWATLCSAFVYKIKWKTSNSQNLSVFIVFILSMLMGIAVAELPIWQ